jgi:hypothetical protein
MTRAVAIGVVETIDRGVNSARSTIGLKRTLRLSFLQGLHIQHKAVRIVPITHKDVYATIDCVSELIL